MKTKLQHLLFPRSAERHRCCAAASTQHPPCLFRPALGKVFFRPFPPTSCASSAQLHDFKRECWGTHGGARAAGGKRIYQEQEV